MKRLFLTGASGFLGGHIYALARKRWDVFATFLHHPPKKLPDQWIALDLTWHATVREYLEDIQPDVIIHAAAISNLDLCEENPFLAEAVNVQTTNNLASWAAAHRIRMIYISSDMVFDGTGSYYTETDPVSPISVYGKCKASAENIVRSKCRKWVVARAALIYGRPKIGGTSFSEWLEGRLRNGKRIPLYYDQFRTPILVENLAEAILELAENDFIGTVHLGGANRVDRLTFGQQLCEIGGYDPSLLDPTSVADAQPRAPRPVDISLSIRRAQSVLRTKLLSTEEGLKRMFGK